MRADEAQLRAWMVAGLDGSAAGHARLLRALVPILRGSFYARRMGAAEEIEDLVQDTLIAIHTRRATYDRERALTAWVFAIARYKMIDHFRRYRPHVPIEGLEEVLGTDGFESATSARLDVEDLLETIPEKQARMIRATRIEGQSIAETAAAHGLGESDVKVSVHRGLKALAARVRGEATVKTDQLIDTLISDVRPVRRHAVRVRLALGIAGGSLASFALILMTLGARPDLMIAMHTLSFWMKWGYTLSLALIAISVAARLARPDPGTVSGIWLAAIPVGLLACVGILELIRTPPGDWLAMWLGASWSKCPWLVLALAMPIFIGLLWSFRRLAPTRLRAAGAAAGLAAGAFAATVYCLHCPEVSALFVLTWYSLGILLAAGIGALLGPRLLRW